MDELIIDQEGAFLDDLDNLIQTMYVDLRSVAQRLPNRTLIKAGEQRYSIESTGQLRISKPSRFRTEGESLISDLGEVRFSRESTDTYVDREPPVGFPRLPRLSDIDWDELISQLPPDVRPDQWEVKLGKEEFTETTTDTVTYGRNGWIYCVSMAPTDKGEEERWRASLPKEYDYDSYIYRPRSFARALATMLTEQVGAFGKRQTFEQTLDGAPSTTYSFSSQLVLHGPVIYVDDPYEWVASVPSNAVLVFGHNFVKHVRYRDQREYRFVLYTEQEPTHEIVDLRVSGDLLRAMSEIPSNATRQGGSC